MQPESPFVSKWWRFEMRGLAAGNAIAQGLKEWPLPRLVDILKEDVHNWKNTPGHLSEKFPSLAPVKRPRQGIPPIESLNYRQSGYFGVTPYDKSSASQAENASSILVAPLKVRFCWSD